LWCGLVCLSGVPPSPPCASPSLVVPPRRGAIHPLNAVILCVWYSVVRSSVTAAFGSGSPFGTRFKKLPRPAGDSLAGSTPRCGAPLWRVQLERCRAQSSVPSRVGGGCQYEKFTLRDSCEPKVSVAIRAFEIRAFEIRDSCIRDSRFGIRDSGEAQSSVVIRSEADSRVEAKRIRTSPLRRSLTPQPTDSTPTPLTP